MIDLRFAEIALEHVEGSAFEKFFQVFYPEIMGVQFVPLGGVHDGGADAFDADSIFEGSGKPTSFYQASVQQDYRAKIGNTIERLRGYGREVHGLVYVTSKNIASIDTDEVALAEKHNATIRIRHRGWIAGHINKSPTTIAAFNTYVRPYASFLSEVGGAHLVDLSRVPVSRTVCVFLGQEVERRRANSDLLTSIADSLILWALHDTDSDKGLLMTREQIRTRIEETLPTARNFLRGVLDHRLAALASKSNTNGREIRWHKKHDLFALPYATRKIVESENLEDEALKLKIGELFEARAARAGGQHGFLPSKVADLAMAAIMRVFEKEGLQFASFLTGSNGGLKTSVSDKVDEILRERAITANEVIAVKPVIMGLLRQAFYESVPEEREFYGTLSRTFTLLFSLRADPEIVNYFKGMSGNFVLYVGADLIIQALSERYLYQEDKMTVNLLKILKDAGSTLVLSEPALEEVKGHLVSTDAEFRSNFSKVEQYTTRDHARHASKILIRTYFYARTTPLEGVKGPTSWGAFIGQFCNYGDLQRQQGKTQIKQYLLEKFGMIFETHGELAEITDEDEVAELTKKLRAIKNDVLAANDARQILAVYGKRHELREEHHANPYGYRTWWLTHEAQVRQHTGVLVGRMGAHYILRPEFVLNFIALSPSAEEVRRAYRAVFPSILGLSLSNRMREDVFRDTMQRVGQVAEHDEARVKVMMGTLANNLKADNFKQYETRFSSDIFS